jgi:hypothetical protein
MCKFCTKFGEIFGHYHKIDVTQYFVTLFLFNDKSFQNLISESVLGEIQFLLEN